VLSEISLCLHYPIEPAPTSNPIALDGTLKAGWGNLVPVKPDRAPKENRKRKPQRIAMVSCAVRLESSVTHTCAKLLLRAPTSTARMSSHGLIPCTCTGAWICCEGLEKEKKL
jgi:hypothetical protein